MTTTPKHAGIRSLVVRLLALLLLVGIGAFSLEALRDREPSQSPVATADAERLAWSDLRPVVETAMSPKPSQFGQTTLAGEAAIAGIIDHEAVAGTFAPPANTPAPARADLDGRRVAISGYMTPLMVEERQTKIFLLVPYVGACIHVPAPPANQIVLVETEELVPVRPMWEPFTAVGTLSVETLDTGLAEVAYTMRLERMVDGVAEPDAASDAAGQTGAGRASGRRASVNRDDPARRR